MGGEVNVYQVREYRPGYLLLVKDFVIDLALSGARNYEIVNQLIEAFPTSIKVGISFYYSIVSECVSSDLDAQDAQNKSRSKQRSDIIKSSLWKNKEIASRKISQSRKDWWENHPEQKEKYAESSIAKKGFGYSKRKRILTRMGYQVRSGFEKFAHEYLNELKIPFKYEIHIGNGRKVDLLIGNLFIEIDGIGRSDDHWSSRFGNANYRIIKVDKSIRGNKFEVLKNELDNIIKDQID